MPRWERTLEGSWDFHITCIKKIIIFKDTVDKRKKEKEKEEDEDDGEDTLDWWSRYYETMKFIDAEAQERKKVAFCCHAK